jgi:hypothetical protein
MLARSDERGRLFREVMIPKSLGRVLYPCSKAHAFTSCQYYTTFYTEYAKLILPVRDFNLLNVQISALGSALQVSIRFSPDQSEIKWKRDT